MLRANPDILKEVEPGAAFDGAQHAPGQARDGSLADVASALSNPARAADALWTEMVGNLHLRIEAHPVVAAAGRGMLDRDARERGSVLSSTKTYLTLLRDPIVAHNTRRSDFRIMDLMDHERPMSLYIVTRGSNKERLRPLVRCIRPVTAACPV